MFFKIIAVLVGKDIEDSYLDFLIELGSQCAEAASHNLAILRDLSTVDRLGMYTVTILLGKIVDILCIAKFGFWDSLRLSSGIIVASVALFIRTNNNNNNNKPQNDDSSCPGHSKQPDYLPSNTKKKMTKSEYQPEIRSWTKILLSLGWILEAQDIKQQYWIFLKSETHLTTNKQLHKGRGIYASLAMVEERCIGYQQSDLPSTLSQDQWQALISY